MMLTVGQRIYYTGDMANIEDEGRIVRMRPADRLAPESYDVKLNDGRIFRGVYHLSFDPGPGRRFWPLDEWEAQRKARLASSILAMQRVINAHQPARSQGVKNGHR